MKITITIENEEGEQIGFATSNTIEMAVQELYRIERNLEREKDKGDVMAESLNEETI